jgi:hypothetical protein
MALSLHSVSISGKLTGSILKVPQVGRSLPNKDFIAVPERALLYIDRSMRAQYLGNALAMSSAIRMSL